MAILDFLIFLLVFLLAIALVALAILVGGAFWLSMPLADVINRVLRRMGLWGPARGSRSIGSRGAGVVDEPFVVSRDGDSARGRVLVQGELWNARCDPALAPALQPGDEVEFTYNEELTLTVTGKRHLPPGADHGKS